MGNVVALMNPNEIKKMLKTQSALMTFAILFIIASVRYEQFLTVLNLSNVLRQVSMIGLIAVGMTFVILIGGIDLSVGSILALSGVVAAHLSNTSLVLAIVVPLLLGIVLGAINGMVVTKMKIAPFIATLAMMMGARGVAYIATGEQTIRVSKDVPLFTKIARGYFLQIPIPVLILIVVVIIAVIVSKHTKFGRHIYAVGGNEEAAKMMGLEVDRIKILAYTISGFMSALAGIILTSRLGAGQPVAGEGWEMNVIAAVVIGGTLLTGGVGKFSGTFFGVLIIGMLTNMFNMQGNINTWWQNVLMGALLLTVIMFQSRVNKKKKA